jgi:hypothetical protein
VVGASVTWVKLDDSFATNPKVFMLSDVAFRAYVMGLCYASYHLTDGFVPAGYVKLKGARELEAAGLWEQDGAGWRIHDYLAYNNSKADVMASVEAKRMAGAKGAAARWHKPKDAQIQIPSTTDPKEPFSSDVTELTQLLVASLRERGVKIPGDLRSWEQTADRLLRIDERPLDEAKAVLAFSQADSFWASNILSMPKFRAQYDQLRLKMQAPSGNGRREETTSERMQRLGIT